MAKQECICLHIKGDSFLNDWSLLDERANVFLHACNSSMLKVDNCAEISETL